MQQHQIPPPCEPDGTKEKALQTAPTVEQGQQMKCCDSLELRSVSAPTETTTQGHTKAARPHFRPQKVSRLQSPRQSRALSALLTGPKTREQIDRIAGASNSPDVIGRLRRRFGMTLPCELERIRDRDGRSVERGVYSLTAQDATKARHLLEGGTL